MTLCMHTNSISIPRERKEKKKKYETNLRMNNTNETYSNYFLFKSWFYIMYGIKFRSLCMKSWTLRADTKQTNSGI